MTEHPIDDPNDAVGRGTRQLIMGTVIVGFILAALTCLVILLSLLSH